MVRWPVARVDLLGVTLELPQGWRGVSAVFIAPDSGAPSLGPIPSLASGTGFRDTVAIAAQPVEKGTTAGTYHQASLRELASEGLQVVKTEDFARPGVSGIRCELVQEGPRGERLRQIQHVFVKDQEAWVLVGTSLDGPSWTKTRERLEAIMASFSF